MDMFDDNGDIIEGNIPLAKVMSTEKHRKTSTFDT
jgi:hypothetical protein